MEIKSLLSNKVFLIAITVFFALAIGLICKYIIKKPIVVPVENIAEKVIDKETGIDFDFSATDTNLFRNREQVLQELRNTVKNCSDIIKQSQATISTTT
jgi:hypothetical protein